MEMIAKDERKDAVIIHKRKKRGQKLHPPPSIEKKNK